MVGKAGVSSGYVDLALVTGRSKRKGKKVATKQFDAPRKPRHYHV
jgi:hypothetical protein